MPSLPARPSSRRPTVVRRPLEQADELAETRLREAEAISADAKSTQNQAAAEKARLERQAAAADKKAAQLRAETEN